MKNVPFQLLLLCALLVVSGCASRGEAQPNRLTRIEARKGYTLLFDGHSYAGWRSYTGGEFPLTGWDVDEGALHHRPGEVGGDIITEEVFGDFDLLWEWKIAPGGNSGLKYFVRPHAGTVIGHEYQMIDDAAHADARLSNTHRSGAFYDVIAPTSLMALPAGEWNRSRLIVRGNWVEHWLNGERVVAYEAGIPEVLEAVKQSKFKNVPAFGMKHRSHILLQDHKDEAWFRNIRIKRY